MKLGKTYLFSRHTVLPKDVPMHDKLVRIIAMIEIDIENEIVVKASFMTLIPHTDQFIGSTAKGYELRQGIAPLIEEITLMTHVVSIKAWVKAIEIAYQKYREFIKNRTQ